ncbi:MAG: hypothetical protein M0022_03175 [Desulfobacteraceae bacterium]|nr:hypothetical protein [Desulfobacteraceae bacterium]
MPVSGKPILVGTVHLDRDAMQGPLRRLLEEASPGVIAVEISPFSVSYRNKMQARWRLALSKNSALLSEKERAHPGLRLLELQIGIPFEWGVSVRYGGERGVRVLAIDSGRLSREEIPFWEERLLCLENLDRIVKLGRFDIEDHFERHHKIAREVIAAPGRFSQAVHPLRWLEGNYWDKREEMLAVRLRRILKICRRTVYVGGWMHIVKGSPYKTLADRLSDFEPVTIFLDRDRPALTRGYIGVLEYEKDMKQ